MSSMDGQPALGIAQRVSFDKREWIWLATVVSTCVAVPVLAAGSSSPHSVGAPVGAASASPVTVREASETDFYGYNGTVQTASAQNGYVQIQAPGGRGGRGEDAGIANGGLSTEVSASWRVREQIGQVETVGYDVGHAGTRRPLPTHRPAGLVRSTRPGPSPTSRRPR